MRPRRARASEYVRWCRGLSCGRGLRQRMDRGGCNRRRIGGSDSKIALRLKRRARLRLAGDFRQGIGTMAAGALKEGADFNRERFVQNRAFHVAGAGELDFPRAHDSLDAAADRALFSDDLALEVCLLADCYRCRANVAVDAPVDLNVARRRECSDHNQIV